MDAEQFSVYRDDAVHELMRLNEQCEQEFHISSWPRWDYEFERGTLTFSQDGVPQVRASIQVIGTTSISGRTWMWGWANESLPANGTKEVAKVRAFGTAEDIPELNEEELPDDEYLGWQLTAVAAKVLGAIGAYRCPDENGFVYVVYTSIGFAKDKPHGVLNREPWSASTTELGSLLMSARISCQTQTNVGSHEKRMRNINGPMLGVGLATLSSRSRVNGMERTNQE